MVALLKFGLLLLAAVLLHLSVELLSASNMLATRGITTEGINRTPMIRQWPDERADQFLYRVRQANRDRSGRAR
jgi:hypothetical protein